MKTRFCAIGAVVTLIAAPGSAALYVYQFENTPVPGFAYAGDNGKLIGLGVSLTSIASEPVSGLVTFSLLDDRQRPFANFSAPFYEECGWVADPVDFYHFELPIWDVDIRMTVDYDPGVGGRTR